MRTKDDWDGLLAAATDDDGKAALWEAVADECKGGEAPDPCKQAVKAAVVTEILSA